MNNNLSDTGRNPRDRRGPDGWRRSLQSGLSRLGSKAIAALLMSATLSGCSALTQPIDGVPADRVPPRFFAEPKNDLIPVDISLLALEPPREYLLGPGDILGIYIEGVLPFNPPNAPPEPPPVNFPDAESTLPPSIGYPIAVQEDGSLALPLIEPLNVAGLTLDQVRSAIRDAYIDNDILLSEKARPIVTVIQERTVDVIVVREDSGGINNMSLGASLIRGGSDQSARGGLVKLRAYQNDILHALVETGGLPGLMAKNQVKVLRANRNPEVYKEFMESYSRQVQAAKLDPCACIPELPDDPTILKIPLRLPPGVTPELTQEQITLQDGDIVYIESRETEVFYTGGMLPGGEFPLPRDYDLDVLGAMALVGQGAYGNTQMGGRGGGGGMGQLGAAVATIPPGRLYILRKTDCNGQIAIEIDLTEAINDPRSRPLVKAGDTLILQFKPEEELLNFGLGTFFTFGIQELLRGN